MTDIQNATLHGSISMPMLGLGVFKAEDGDEVRNAVTWALEDGYRLIDTAAIYRNEVGVGQAIAESTIPRDDIFVTTKLWNSEQGYESTLAAMDESLERLRLDHVDLYLIHWPIAEETAATWRAMEHLQEQGLTRAIGISNFEPHHLEQLMTGANVAPAVNQVELHPTLHQQHIRDADDEVGVLTQAWSPLKQGKSLTDPVIVGIANSLGVTPAQAIIRWALQSGISVIPKSVREERIQANFDVYSFALSDADMAAFAELNSGDRVGPYPDDRDF